MNAVDFRDGIADVAGVCGAAAAGVFCGADDGGGRVALPECGDAGDADCCVGVSCRVAALVCVYVWAVSGHGVCHAAGGACVVAGIAGECGGAVGAAGEFSAVPGALVRCGGVRVGMACVVMGRATYGAASCAVAFDDCRFGYRNRFMVSGVLCSVWPCGAVGLIKLL
mgnify:CR=1 FL=1